MQRLKASAKDVDQSSLPASLRIGLALAPPDRRHQHGVYMSFLETGERKGRQEAAFETRIPFNSRFFRKPYPAETLIPGLATMGA
jgi:hypothetical protein